MRLFPPGMNRVAPVFISCWPHGKVIPDNNEKIWAEICHFHHAARVQEMGQATGEHEHEWAG